MALSIIRFTGLRFKLWDMDSEAGAMTHLTDVDRVGMPALRVGYPAVTARWVAAL